MKNLSFKFLLIFISSITFAQTDTLISINNASYNCYVVNIDAQGVKIFHPKSQFTTFNLKQLKSIIINNYGEVYSNEKGLLKNLESLQIFLKQREQFRKFKNIKEASKFGLLEKNEIEVNEKSNFYFSFFYVPYSLNNKEIYKIINNSSSVYMPRYYLLEKHNADMDYIFGIKIKNITFLNLMLTYSSNSIEINNNNQTINQNPPNVVSSSFYINSSLSLLTLRIGVKHFLMSKKIKKVIPFLSFYVGKTFAWAKEEYKNFYNSEFSFKSNREEFLGDINSLYHIGFGAGVEYFFNPSISLYTAVFQGYQFSPEAEFQQTNETSYHKTIYKEKKQISQSETKVGVGLNFYF